MAKSDTSSINNMYETSDLVFFVFQQALKHDSVNFDKINIGEFVWIENTWSVNNDSSAEFITFGNSKDKTEKKVRKCFILYYLKIQFCNVIVWF